MEKVHMEKSLIVRPARKEEARRIAELFLLSSDGLAEYIWQNMAEGREIPLEVGAKRYAREGELFSYQNCLVAEIKGQVAGMALSFFLPKSEAPRKPDSDPVLAPYSELEDGGSLYLAGIALYPQFQAQGLGRRLLKRVHAKARVLGINRVSLICFEANRNAMALYRSEDYAELDRRPLVPHPCLHYQTGDALLMARTV